MRRRDSYNRAVSADPMDLLHRSDYVLEMLETIGQQHRLEMIIRQRPRNRVQIMHQIWVDGGLVVYVEGIGQIFPSAAKLRIPRVERSSLLLGALSRFCSILVRA